MLAIRTIVGLRLITCIEMGRARRFMAYSAIFVALIISALPASGQDLILSAQDNCSLGNCTLHIVDVDTQTAKVWLVISDPGGPMISEILGILGANDTLPWKNYTLTVSGIYAGESSDLVFLRINSSD
ncbi:MAG: hypothetical protein CG443_856 [Methanosaeta sp. ASP1-1]|nr:MAG: hypothetical protein CG443_856 [Methanosaeta sp. ASP1-1]